MTKRIVIVGGGLAAARAVRAYRDAGGEAPVTVLSAETVPPYNRPPLSKGFLRGEIERDAVFVEPLAAYADLDVQLELETSVTGVDTRRRVVTVAGDAELAYDRLVLATGALPRPLGVPGEE